LRVEATFVGIRRNGTNIPPKLALSFVRTIGVGDGTSATSGANTKAEDTGAVGVGWNLSDRKRGAVMVWLPPRGGNQTNLIAHARVDLFVP
jgi:hypothetical protein